MTLSIKKRDRPNCGNLSEMTKHKSKYSTNLFKRNDIIVYCNFLKTDRIFSWNTSKFSSCPVDAENGFKLDNLINMKEDMYIFVSRVRIKIPQFLLLKIDCQY